MVLFWQHSDLIDINRFGNNSGVNTMEEAYYKTTGVDTEINARAEISPECSVEKTKSKRKSPVLAALLSLIIPGLGQAYAGDLLRGFALLVG